MASVEQVTGLFQKLSTGSSAQERAPTAAQLADMVKASPQPLETAGIATKLKEAMDDQANPTAREAGLEVRGWTRRLLAGRPLQSRLRVCTVCFLRAAVQTEEGCFQGQGCSGFVPVGDLGLFPEGSCAEEGCFQGQRCSGFAPVGMQVQLSTTCIPACPKTSCLPEVCMELCACWHT